MDGYEYLRRRAVFKKSFYPQTKTQCHRQGKEKIVYLSEYIHIYIQSREVMSL